MKYFTLAFSLIFSCFYLSKKALAQGFGHYNSSFGCPFFNRFGSGGMFFSLLIWIIVILSVIFLSKSLFKKNTKNSSEALTILQKRFAGGEIDEEEFNKKKKALS